MVRISFGRLLVSLVLALGVALAIGACGSGGSGEGVEGSSGGTGNVPFEQARAEGEKTPAGVVYKYLATISEPSSCFLLTESYRDPGCEDDAEDEGSEEVDTFRYTVKDRSDTTATVLVDSVDAENPDCKIEYKLVVVESEWKINSDKDVGGSCT